MLECPICLRDIEISPDAREGDVIQCPYCKEVFKLIRSGGQWALERADR